VARRGGIRGHRHRRPDPFRLGYTFGTRNDVFVVSIDYAVPRVRVIAFGRLEWTEGGFAEAVDVAIVAAVEYQLVSVVDELALGNCVYLGQQYARVSDLSRTFLQKSVG
jgi:carbohydrate-binding DOMON domain-containing protein